MRLTYDLVSKLMQVQVPRLPLLERFHEISQRTFDSKYEPHCMIFCPTTSYMHLVRSKKEELERLEGIIAAGLLAFVGSGLALREIHLGELYRASHPTWQSYVQERWGMSHEQARRLMAAARIVQKDLTAPIGGVPAKYITNESQIRPLTRLKKGEHRRQVFEAARRDAGDAPPTAEQVTDALRRFLANMSRPTKRFIDHSRPYDPALRVICGDSLDPQLIPSESVDLVVGSPPYNLGVSHPTHTDDLPAQEYARRREQWLTNCLDWCASGGRLAINIPLDVRRPLTAPSYADLVRNAVEVGWIYLGTIIWDEGSHSTFPIPADPPASPLVICSSEMIALFAKDNVQRDNPGVDSDVSPTNYRQWMQGRWHIAGAHASKIGHPCPYPAEVPRRLIQMFSYPGDTVLDPWMGAGTTIIEARKLGRKAIGIDIEESYCLLAQTRLAELTDTSTTKSKKRKLKTHEIQ